MDGAQRKVCPYWQQLCWKITWNKRPWNNNRFQIISPCTFVFWSLLVNIERQQLDIGHQSHSRAATRDRTTSPQYISSWIQYNSSTVYQQLDMVQQQLDTVNQLHIITAARDRIPAPQYRSSWIQYTNFTALHQLDKRYQVYCTAATGYRTSAP